MSGITTFVESCVQTAAGKAAVVGRNARGRPRARRLLKALSGKRNILVTTHQHPDPDALASCIALRALLRANLARDTKVSVSIKGQIGGGINDAFTRHAQLDLVAWDDAALPGSVPAAQSQPADSQSSASGSAASPAAVGAQASQQSWAQQPSSPPASQASSATAMYDAVILLDVQPVFAYSPLPPGVSPTAVIDHHRARGPKPRCPFCDIRSDVGATCSIIFSYFMELETPISPDLAASMLYAIESDLAGAAGTPTSLDQMALSSLTLLADTARLYRMRYVDLPQSYYAAYYNGIANAIYFGGGDSSRSDGATASHLGEIDSLEQPAVIADFLLRFEKVQWSLVTALYEGRLVFSLRSSDARRSAGEIARRLIRNIGEGGGHRTKAGGFVRLDNGSPTEVERVRKVLRRRLLRALGIRMSRGQRLVPQR